MTAKLRALKATNRPSGMYWMKSRSGIDMQVRADDIVLAEPVNGDDVTIVYLGSYDREHQLIVAQNIRSLYDRPVVATGNENDQN